MADQALTNAATRAAEGGGASDATSARSGVVSRAVTLLELVSTEPNGVGVRDAARQTGIDRSAVSRIFAQLEELDCVRQDGERGLYTVGPRMFMIAAVLRGQDSLWNAAQPILRGLVDRYGETVYLAVRANNRVVFRDKIDCTHNIRYVIELGKPFPLTTGGASASAILAGMPDAEVEAVLAEGDFDQHTPISLTDADAFRRILATDRQRGYSVSLGRWVRNGAGISAPFFGSQGVCVGAITLSCPADRLEAVSIPEVGASMLEASRQLSRRIGHLGTWGPASE